MSYIIPLSAQEIEKRLLKVPELDSTLHTFYEGTYETIDDINCIVITIAQEIASGLEIKFRAPVACTEVTQLCVKQVNTENYSIFAFADANGNDIGEVANLFAAEAIVKVILDPAAKLNGVPTPAAFVQNANTNEYLESTLREIRDTKVSAVDLDAQLEELLSKIENVEAGLPSGDGEGSAVIGSGNASGANSTVIGSGNALGVGSTVIGSGTASGTGATSIGSSTAIGDYSMAGGTTDSSLVKDITGVDINTLTDDMIVNALGERGIRLKDNLQDSLEPTATGAASTTYGTGTNSITALSSTQGAGTEAGSKGFYIHKITIPEDDGDITVSLSTTQKPYYKYQQRQYVIYGDLVWKEGNTDTKTWNTEAGTILSNWSAGDAVNIILKKIFCVCEDIVSVDSTNGNITITNTGGITASDLVEAIEFEGSTGSVEALAAISALVPYQFSVAVPAKPDIGIVELHFAATATGLGSIAAGTLSQAHGSMNLAAGQFGFVVGQNNVSGYGGFASGQDNTALGYNSHAEGSGTKALGSGAHTEGKDTQALGNYSHAEGRESVAKGLYSHTEGYTTEAGGLSAHAEGRATKAIGDYSHAEGYSTTASGNRSHAEGSSTTASGLYSHAEGYSTEASGSRSHAEGYDTTAIGDYSHAEGYSTTASGATSHAEGRRTVASGIRSHAEGYQTIASGEIQHVQGKFNIEDTENKYAHIVGNGTSDTKRSNAHTIDWDGNAWFAGKVFASNNSNEQYQLATINKAITNDSVWSTLETIKNTYPQTTISSTNFSDEILRFTPDWLQCPVKFDTDGYTDKIHLYKTENLLGFYNTTIHENGEVTNGITYTQLKNGKLHAEGTFDGGGGRGLKNIGTVTLPAGKYIFWVDGANASIYGSLYPISVNEDGETTVDIDGRLAKSSGKGVQFELTKDTTVLARVLLATSASTVNVELGFSITRGTETPITFSKYEGKLLDVIDGSIETEAYRGTNYAYVIPSTSTLEVTMYHNIVPILNKAKSLPNIYSGTKEPTDDIGQIGDIYIVIEESDQ